MRRGLYFTIRVFLVACVVGLCETHSSERPRVPEYPSDEVLVNAFASVFSVQGKPVLKGVSVPVSYAADRLRILLGSNTDRLDLNSIRTLDQHALLALAFKAVAGDYVTGPGNFNSACHFTSDPVTGTLELYHNTAENTTVLTVMSTVLLAVLLTLMAKGNVFTADAGE